MRILPLSSWISKRFASKKDRDFIKKIGRKSPLKAFSYNPKEYVRSDVDVWFTHKSVSAIIENQIGKGERLMSAVKAGIVGCGNISDIYFQLNERFDAIQVIACTDLNYAQALKQAEKYRGVEAQTMDEFFDNREIEIVINLTVPSAHYVVHKRALESGKHSYGEKPLALALAEADELQTIANEKGVLLGAAPDTFLGGGLQTCRKLIDDGWIGQPVSANGFMMNHGPESWHPNPEFFYKIGQGQCLIWDLII